MADVKIKVLSAGKIPGYPVSGPILNPIVVDEKEALRYINSGLKVVIWNDQIQDFAEYNSLDMVDFFNEKNEIIYLDEEHKCPICNEDPHDLIARTRVKNTEYNVNSFSVKHNNIMPGDPVETVFNIPEPIDDGAYEPAPIPIDRSMCYSKPAVKEIEEELPPELLIDTDEFEEK